MSTDIHLHRCLCRRDKLDLPNKKNAPAGCIKPTERFSYTILVIPVLIHVVSAIHLLISIKSSKLARLVNTHGSGSTTVDIPSIVYTSSIGLINLVF